MDTSPRFPPDSAISPVLRTLLCLSLASVLTSCAVYTPQASASPATQNPAPPMLESKARRNLPYDTETIKAMAEEYRSLRNIPGHFGSGNPDPRVDRWQGRKHQLMQQLGQYVLDQQLSVTALEQLMGPPDRLFAPGEPHYDSFFRQIEWQAPNPPTTQSELMIYYFRSGHDQMLFASDNDQVSALGWFHAYE